MEEADKETEQLGDQSNDANFENTPVEEPSKENNG
jgi:hypothetical protein